MNYRVFLDSSTRPFLSKFNALPELRPKVKDIIRIGHSGLWTVTRIVTNTVLPSILTDDNFTLLTDDNEEILLDSQPSLDEISLDYFVRKLDTSPDSVTMDGSRQSFRKSVLSF